MQNLQIPPTLPQSLQQNGNSVIFQVQSKRQIICQKNQEAKESHVSNQVVQEKKAAAQQTQPKCFEKRKKFIVLTGALAAILIFVGLGVGLWWHLRPKIIDVKPSTQINFGSQGVVMTEMKLKEVNILKQNLQFSIIRTSLARPANSRLLQEEPNSDQFTTTINFKQQGITVQVGQDHSITMLVDPLVFQGYIISQNPETARLLETATDFTEQDRREFEAQFSEIVSEVFNNNRSVAISRPTYVDFVIDPTTKQLRLDRSQPSRLLSQRLLRGKYLKKIKQKVIKNIVKPAVQAVKKAGAIIGAVAGGVIAGVVLGPAMIPAGVKIGLQVGSYAQSAVKACVPKDQLKIKCDETAVSQLILKQVAGAQVKQVFSGFSIRPNQNETP